MAASLQVHVFYPAAQRSQLFESLCSLFLLGRRAFGGQLSGRRAMPAKVIFHVIDALAGDGMRNDANRLFDDCLCLLAGINNLLKVMSVNIKHVPAKGLISFA